MIERRALTVVSTIVMFDGAALATSLSTREMALRSFDGDPASADYLWGPFDIALPIVVLATAIGAALVLGSFWAARALIGELPRLRLAVALAAVAGTGAGGCFALITAPSIGANIGGGMAIMFGLPLVALIFGAAIVAAISSTKSVPS